MGGHSILLQIFCIQLVASNQFILRRYQKQERRLLSVHTEGSKIVGGSYVQNMRERPYMVSITKYGKHHCGGSLLTTNFVVTACHCLAKIGGEERLAQTQNLKMDVFQFIAGTTNLKKYESSVQIREAESFHWHPKCGTVNSSVVYDLGLAKMEDVFLNTPYVHPIKMFTWNKRRFKKYFRKMLMAKHQPVCTVAGWGEYRKSARILGKPSVRLKAVQMFVISNKQCRQSWYEMMPEQFKGHDFVKYGQICAVSEHLNSSDCDGDSGSPYVCDGYFVAVVSFGSRCGTEDPSVYQTVEDLIDWCRKDFAGEIDMKETHARRKTADATEQIVSKQPGLSQELPEPLHSNQHTITHNTRIIIAIVLLRETLEKL